MKNIVLILGLLGLISCTRSDHFNHSTTQDTTQQTETTSDKSSFKVYPNGWVVDNTGNGDVSLPYFYRWRDPVSKCWYFTTKEGAMTPQYNGPHTVKCD